MTKATAQKQHARRRFRDRLGVCLTKNKHRELVNQIRAGKLAMVKEQSKRVKLYRATISGEEVNLVYDATRSLIITVFLSNQST
jgi:hypothetical protein